MTHIESKDFRCSWSCAKSIALCRTAMKSFTIPLPHARTSNMCSMTTLLAYHCLSKLLILNCKKNENQFTALSKNILTKVIAITSHVNELKRDYIHCCLQLQRIIQYFPQQTKFFVRCLL